MIVLSFLVSLIVCGALSFALVSAGAPVWATFVICASVGVVIGVFFGLLA